MTNNSKPVCAADLIKERDSERDRFLTRHRGYVELKYGTGYDIQHSRMDTPEKLLGWILHLTEKMDIETGHIHELIEAAMAIGVKVDRNA